MAVDTTWKPVGSFTYNDAFVVTPDASTTMYVHYHAGLGKRVTVQADSAFGSPNGVMRTADAVEGPWSELPVPRDAGERRCRKGRGLLRGDGAPAVWSRRREHAGRHLRCNTLGTIVPMDDLDLYLPKTVIVDLGLDDAPVTDAPHALAGNGT